MVVGNTEIVIDDDTNNSPNFSSKQLMKGNYYGYETY